MSFVNIAKSATATFTDATKHSSTFSNAPTKLYINDFLLKEDSFYLLLETGSKIILEQTYPLPAPWANISKS